KQVRDVEQRRRRLRQRFFDDRVRMAQRDDGKPTDEVEIPAALFVPHLGSTAAHETHRRFGKDRDERARILCAEDRTAHCEPPWTMVPMPAAGKISRSS